MQTFLSPQQVAASILPTSQSSTQNDSILAFIIIFAEASRATRNPQKYAETPYQIPLSKTPSKNTRSYTEESLGRKSKLLEN